MRYLPRRITTPFYIAACILAVLAPVYGWLKGGHPERFGVVVLLLWLQITFFLVLLGAELNAELEHQTAEDTTNPADWGLDTKPGGLSRETKIGLALVGAILPGNFVIKESKIRGQPSSGMMCSPDEIGMGSDHSGLLLLPGKPALGLPMHEALPAGDTIFDIEVTPNRPDCQSHLGIARELAAWFRLPLMYPQETFRGALPENAAERTGKPEPVKPEPPKKAKAKRKKKGK